MSGSTNDRVYEFGSYRLEAAAQVLYSKVDGKPIPLTARVYDTLLFLVEHPNELLDKRRLMSAIWPNLVVEENNLDQNISTLRQVLGERRGENRYIVTVRGRGYRFVAPVSIAAPVPKAVEPARAPAESAPVHPTAPPANAHEPRRRVAIAGAAGVALALAAVAVAWWLNRSPEPAAQADEAPRLAV